MSWAEWTYRVLAMLEWGGKNGCPGLQNGCVLVFAPGHLGDFLQLTPMLRTLRSRLRNRRIVWLIGNWSMEIATRYADWADEIFDFSPQTDTLTRNNGKWVQSIIKQRTILRGIRRQEVAVLISTMPEDLIPRFVINTLRPRLWVGVGDHIPPRLSKDIKTVMSPFETDVSEAIFQLKLAQRVCAEMLGQGIQASLSSSLDLTFSIKVDECVWAKEFLFVEGVDNKPLSLLALESGWPSKNRSSRRFGTLATRLLAKGMDVAWTVSASEVPFCVGPGHNWAGLLTLGQLSAVMENATVWGGNDSGLLHLAVAIGWIILSFLGPTSEGKWGGQGVAHVKIRGIPRCPRCIYWNWRRAYPKEGHPCMSAISVDVVEWDVGHVLGWT